MKLVPVCLFCFVIFICSVNKLSAGKKYVSNLSTVCLRCLCHASTACNMSLDCQKGYCGPFFINKDFWTDGGKPTLKDDDPDRQLAFNDCVKDYQCAVTTIENYMAKHGYDCNNDGVTDCDDYARLLFHGKDKCGNTIANSNYGKRYESCRPVATITNNDRT